jgi:hypothetical protein
LVSLVEIAVLLVTLAGLLVGVVVLVAALRPAVLACRGDHHFKVAPVVVVVQF